MIKLHFKNFLLLSVSLLLILSCAKEVSETTEEVQRRILNAYMNTHNFPDLETLDDGLYVLSRTEGTGDKVTDSCFIYIQYSVKYFSGIYSVSTYDSVAKLLGSYDHTKFYGDYVWAVGDGSLSDPVETVLHTMRVGGKTTSIIPPWLTAVEVESSGYSVTSSTDENCLIYDIQINDMYLDIDQHQIDLLEEFSNKYYGGVDSLSLGFYCVKTYDSGDTSTISDGTSIDVDYIGKLLDGTVFDTNIQDTAKKYGLYDASTTYSALSVSYYADSSQFAEESSVVLGFAKALTSHEMTYGDKCITFFDSNNGYGSSGSLSDGIGVPGYYPMFFEIWVREKDDD